eukprot:2612935-Amphidinium_carterae.1
MVSVGVHWGGAASQDIPGHSHQTNQGTWPISSTPCGYDLDTWLLAVIMRLHDNIYVDMRITRHLQMRT